MLLYLSGGGGGEGVALHFACLCEIESKNFG